MMLDGLFDLAVAVLAVILALAASRRLLMAYSALRLYRPAKPAGARPKIWIICACRNEERCLPRLMSTLPQLPYTGERRILLIDDCSTDLSPALLREAAAADPTNLQVALLEGRQRGKADALRDALAGVTLDPADVIFVIDADHRLQDDALEKVANYFAAPDVAAVATEHPVDRPSRSLVSAYCYLEAAMSELVTSRGQHGLGLSTKLAGCWACRADIFERLFPRGWLADDIVFTASILADGGRIAYAADVVAVQDVPDTVKGYVSQHMRWAAGFAESAPAAIWVQAGRWTPLQFLDAVVTHAGYFERALLVFGALLAPLAWLISENATPGVVMTAVVLFYGLVLLAQIIVALRLSGASARLVLMAFASLPMLCVDVIVSLRGMAMGLMKRRVAWTTDHR